MAFEFSRLFKGNKIFDPSEPSCLFVIPGSCDFVVFVLVDLFAKQTTKKHEHKTNPHEGRNSGESGMLLPFQRFSFEVWAKAAETAAWVSQRLVITGLKPRCELKDWPQHIFALVATLNDNLYPILRP